jgi:hypothetical protein
LQIASSFDADAASVRRITEELGTATPVARTPEFRIREMEQLALRLREANERLDHARQRERAIEASRRELVAWISHDLRSPLASIRALAEALEDQVVTDQCDVERYHRSIRLESERLSALVDDLFELSKLQAGTERDSSNTIEIGDPYPTPSPRSTRWPARRECVSSSTSIRLRRRRCRRSMSSGSFATSSTTRFGTPRLAEPYGSKAGRTAMPWRCRSRTSAAASRMPICHASSTWRFEATRLAGVTAAAVA